MTNIMSSINRIIGQIQENNTYKKIELVADKRIVKDLGFSSLDVAELIANLELEFGVDPFTEDVSLMEVHTIGELESAYVMALNKKNREKE